LPRCASCSTWSAHAGIRQFRDLRRTRPERWTPPNDGVPRRHTVKAGSSRDSPGYHPAGLENQTPDPVRRRAAIRPAQGSSVRLPRPVSALPGTVSGVRNTRRVTGFFGVTFPLARRQLGSVTTIVDVGDPIAPRRLRSCPTQPIAQATHSRVDRRNSRVRHPASTPVSPSFNLCHRGSSSPRQIVRAIWFGPLPFSMLFWLFVYPLSSIDHPRWRSNSDRTYRFHICIDAVVVHRRL